MEMKKNDKDEAYFELGNSKRASICSFKGKSRIDVREYYTCKKSGEEKPGSKGCSLPEEMWARLKSASPIVNRFVKVRRGRGGEGWRW